MAPRHSSRAVTTTTVRTVPPYDRAVPVRPLGGDPAYVGGQTRNYGGSFLAGRPWRGPVTLP